MTEQNAAYPVTERSRVRRLHQLGSHERAAVHAVLDAARMAHVGYVIDGEPYVTPTLHWREGDRVWWHGSSASRFLRKTEDRRVCLTASLLDGYVLARSAFNHSVNYRLAMVFGTARLVKDGEEALDALRRFTERLFPGRWGTLRPVRAQEMKATGVMVMEIEEASVKVRAGPPDDDDEADVPVWAGVLPIETRFAAPQAAPDIPAGLAFPKPLAALYGIE